MDLNKLAEKAKNAKLASHIKNNLVAYACGAVAVACVGNGKFKTSEFIGDDGHAGVKIEGAADNARALGGLAFGSVAACSVFLKTLRKMENANKSNDIAKLKMMEKANGR